MFKKIIAILLFCILTNSTALSQIYSETEKVISKTAEIVEQQFFSQQIGSKLAKTLRKNLLDDKYLNMISAEQLERQLTDELRKLSGDNHIGIVYSPKDVLRYRARLNAKKSKKAHKANIAYQLASLNESKLENFGIKKVQLMAGKIGYLEMDYFDGFVDESAATFENTMNLLAGADAIILDLRRNGGGNSKILPLFLSYFIGPDATHFATRYERWNKGKQKLITFKNVRGARHYDKPIYILTSGTTFSLAEHVTYHLRAFRSATVIGERTYGGGKAFDPVIINDDFYIRIPRIEMINAITNTMYVEGQGITPDIKTTADMAFDRAYFEALENLKKSKNTQEEKGDYEWVQRIVSSKINAATIDLKLPFTKGELQFDEFLFQNRNDEIWMSFRNLPWVKLINLGEGYFYDDRSIQRQFSFTMKENLLILTIERFGSQVRTIKQKVKK